MPCQLPGTACRALMIGPVGTEDLRAGGICAGLGWGGLGRWPVRTWEKGESKAARFFRSSWAGGQEHPPLRRTNTEITSAFSMASTLIERRYKLFHWLGNPEVSRECPLSLKRDYFISARIGCGQMPSTRVAMVRTAMQALLSGGSVIGDFSPVLVHHMARTMLR